MNKFIADTYSWLISAAWVLGILLLIAGTFFALKAEAAPTYQVLFLSGASFVILVLGLGFVSVVIAAYETLKETKAVMERLEVRLSRAPSTASMQEPLMYP